MFAGKHWIVGGLYTQREVAAKMKHMSLSEGLILDRYMQLHRNIGKWSFDVRLDVQNKTGLRFANLTNKQMWESLKQKRIDAICETEESIHIFEVKKKINFAQFGQLLTYLKLFKIQYFPTKQIILHALAESIDPEISWSMQDYNISIDIV